MCASQPPLLGCWRLCEASPLTLTLVDVGLFLVRSGECKPFKEAYMKCLRGSGNNARVCRDLSKAYLECRMERCATMLPAPVSCAPARYPGASAPARVPWGVEGAGCGLGAW